MHFICYEKFILKILFLEILCRKISLENHVFEILTGTFQNR